MTDDELDLELAAAQSEVAALAWPTLVGSVQSICDFAADFGVIAKPKMQPTGHLTSDIAEMFRDIHRIAGLVVERLDAPSTRN